MMRAGHATRLNLLTSSERQQMLEEWNATQRDVAAAPIHVLFESQAALTPDATAVVNDTESLSYAALRTSAARWARTLRDRGVAHGSIVAVAVPAWSERVALWLGIQACGAVYLPLDCSSPAARLAWILDDADPVCIVTTESVSTRLPTHRTQLLIAGPETHSRPTQDAMTHAPETARTVDPKQPSYIIYTSGSTGTPKGVVVTHAGIASLRASQIERLFVTAQSRVLQFASPSVDASIWEHVMALTTGAALVVPSEDQRSGSALYEALARYNVTHATLPPSVLVADCRAMPSIETLVVAGEACPDVVVSRCAEGHRLVNAYGPTETTVCATMSRPLISAPAPIGNPVANARVYVLDDALEPAPIGVRGELYVAGPALAQGYLSRPALTAERFVANPFGSPGDRMYRTGDLVRWRADGQIEFVGRTDFQIKLRGFRIEPAEIEAALRRDTRVRDALVLARGDGVDQRLVAYVLANDAHEPSALTQALQSQVRDLLPDHMIPSAVVVLDAWPVTSAGKVDRTALPPPSLIAETPSTFGGTPEEQVLCTVFASVLGLDRVEPDGDFFGLGGHSLLAVRVVGQIADALGVEIDLSVLFEAPRIRDLAVKIREALTKRPRLSRQERPNKVPLSYGQRRLWVLDRLASSTAYNAPQGLRLRGRLDVAALEQALTEIVARHESLRTRVAVLEGEPWQVVAPPAPVTVAVEDLRGWAPAAQAAEIRAAWQREWEEPFDLERGPLLRARLLRVGPEEHVLLRTLHHMVTDGWSEGVFNRELLALYAAARAGARAPLPPLPVQYADFTLWQRAWLESGALAVGLAAWTRQLAGSPARLALPTDRPRPPVQTFVAALYQVQVPAAELAALKRVSQTHQTTLYMTLLAGFSVLLARYSGQDDLVVGSPIANRQDAQLEDLIGFFVNVLALRVQVAPTQTFAELLAAVRRTTLDAYRHQDVPFEKLVETLAPARHLNTTPLFQVVLALQNAPWVAPRLTDLVVEPATGDDLKVRYDIEVYAREEADGLHLAWMYNRDLFDRERIVQMMRHYRTILGTLTASPERKIGSVSLLESSEQHDIIHASNASVSDVPRRTLPAWFEAQASRTPIAPAVISYADEDDRPTLSYAELNAQANQVAHALIARGIGPDDVVAMGLGTSVTAIIALLGVLKAGAAYLPLDPSYPAARVRFVLSDARPRLALTTAARARHVSDVPLLTLDDPDTVAALSRQPTRNPTDADRRCGLNPRHLAYVLYTSGSTGVPKGVGVTHDALATYLTWATDRYGAADGIGAPLSTPLAFDATVTSLYVPLLTGKHVIVLPEDRELEALGALLGGGTELSLVKLTPTHLHALSDLLGPTGIAACRARQFIVGGESLGRQVAELWQRRSSSLRIVNEYGPTEATVGCCIHQFDTYDRGDSVAIGTCVPNSRLYVLDGSLTPTPIGVPGELYIGGGQLARGYVNRAALTSSRFIADPYGQPGTRMYRTGDLVQRQRDGTLVFLGRTDTQVKAHGVRIELGEIVSVVRQDPRVKDGVAIVRREGMQTRLIAYVLADIVRSAADALSSELQTRLRDALPSAMVPAAVVVLDAWPRTANGKLDQAALPAPDARTDIPNRTAQTAEERILARLFADALGVAHVPIDVSFFTLGGDSMLSIQLVSKARAAGLHITPRDVFEHPSVESLAAVARPVTPSAKLGDAEITNAFDRVLPLRAHGARPPLFCLPPAIGIGWSYTKLTEALDPERPVYCLQAAGIADGTAFPADVDAFAAYFLAAMRSVQPSGPYHLLGWSFGGLVAHAMAAQIQKANEEVRLLALIDAYPASAFSFRAEEPRVDGDIVKEYTRQRVRRKKAEGIREIEMERIAELVPHVSSICQAFQPARIAGDLMLFMARDRIDLAETWRPYITGRLITHMLPYSHRETATLPLIEVGQRLEAYLADLTSFPEKEQNVHGESIR